MLRFLSVLTSVVCLSSIGGAQQTTSVLSHANADIRAAFVVRPASIVGSKIVQNMMTAADEKTLRTDLFSEFQRAIGLDPRQIEELAIILDQRTLYSMAEIEMPRRGTESKEGTDILARLNEQKNRLKQIGLALHNFYETHGTFPDYDGLNNADKGKLSWRVFLLPFLDEQALFEQFKLDEPWDSENNKPLIEKMPAVFRTPGVKEKGKTSLHVITGRDTIFSGDGAAKMQSITDGTSNTIMTVVAGPDKAETWTKPGGLKYKPDGLPKELLGDVAEQFLFGRADGSVSMEPSSMDADEFRRMVLINDGEPLHGPTTIKERTAHLPTVLIRGNTPLDQQALLTTFQGAGTPIKRTTDGVTYYDYNGYIVCFPNQRVGIAAPADLLPRLLQNKQQSPFIKEVADLSADHDVVCGIDIKGIPEFMEETTGQLPMAGIIQKIEILKLTTDLSGKTKYLHGLRATATDRQGALALSGLLMGVVQMQKVQVKQLENVDIGIPPALVKLAQQIYHDAEVGTEEAEVYYHIRKPEDLHNMPLAELRPAFQAAFSGLQQELKSIRLARFSRGLRQIGLAFHNFHDVHSTFPPSGENPDKDKEAVGLSWRVHLLPYLGHAGLYKQFDLDESWDSDANKPLIKEMPDVYKSQGVDDPTKTSFHVFLGEKAPFGQGHEGVALDEYTDGLSNTILVVQAGPDKAEIWTRPGGLEINGEDTLKLLGRIGGSIITLLADGSVHELPPDTDDETLNKLIMHADGNPVNVPDL